MTWQFIAAGTVATGANPTPGLPAGYAAGDLLVFVHASSASSGTNNPSGYTNLVRNTSASPFLAVWYKKAASSESAVSITNSDASSKAVVLCYRNIGSTDVIGSIVTGSTTTVTTGSVTTNGVDDLVLQLYGAGKTSASTGSWSAITGCTSRVTSGTSTTLCGILCGDENKAAAGATTGRAGTISRASTGTQGVVLTFYSATISTIAATDGSDTASVTAQNWTTSAIAATDGSDTASAAATVTTGATITSTDSGDTAAITAANWRTASISATDGSDTASAAATVTTGATITSTDSGDTAAIAANVSSTTSATIAATDGSDTASISATVSGITPGTSCGSLLLENGCYLLLENGYKLALEWGACPIESVSGGDTAQGFHAPTTDWKKRKRRRNEEALIVSGAI